MFNLITIWISGCALATALIFVSPAFAGQAGAAKDVRAAKAQPGTKGAEMAAPSDQDIAAAKAKGLVWVNTNTKVYHKDGQFYGKTKQGKFMTEADAQKEGFHAAKEPAVGKKKSGDAKKPAAGKK